MSSVARAGKTCVSPRSPSTRRPFSRIAVRWAPRATKVTSAPALARAAPYGAPMPPVPITAMRMRPSRCCHAYFRVRGATRTGGNHGAIDLSGPRAHPRHGPETRGDRGYADLRRGVGTAATVEARPQPDHRRGADGDGPRGAARRPYRARAQQRRDQGRDRRTDHPSRLLLRLAHRDDRGIDREGRVRAAVIR